MYCKRCYADLSGAKEPNCPACGRAFDLDRPRTYLARPFPGPGRIAFDLIATTVVAIGAALVVAFHQAARTSGH